MKAIRYMALAVALLAVHTVCAAKLKKLSIKEGGIHTLCFKGKEGHIWKVESIKNPNVVSVEAIDAGKAEAPKKQFKFHAGQPGTTTVIITHGKPGDALKTKEFEVTIIKAKKAPAKKTPTKTTAKKVKAPAAPKAKKTEKIAPVAAAPVAHVAATPLTPVAAATAMAKK